MLSELSSIILREIILRFDEYQSILNFKLINKRIFKFINNDIIIQEHYLKLKYLLKISRSTDLPKLIKILDSKSYNEIIGHKLINNVINAVFFNSHDQSFIINFKSIGCVDNTNYIVFLEDNNSAYKIADIFIRDKLELLEETLISENYFLVGGIHHIDFKIFNKFRKMSSIGDSVILFHLHSKSFEHRIVKFFKK